VTAVYQLCIADKSPGSVAELKVSAETKTDQHNTYVTVKSSACSQLVRNLLCPNHSQSVVQFTYYICVWNLVCHRTGSKQIDNLGSRGNCATSTVWYITEMSMASYTASASIVR
jgi:hypothetical protein